MAALLRPQHFFVSKLTLAALVGVWKIGSQAVGKSDGEDRVKTRLQPSNAKGKKNKVNFYSLSLFLDL